MNEVMRALNVESSLDVVWALLDFAIVYALIYQVLLIIRGTRGVQLLVWFLLIIVGFFVSKDEYLGLSTIHWLLDKFIGSFFLVTVVLFQNDIRRGLSNFGKNSFFFRELSHSDSASLVEELVKSANSLSRAHIGGLIAIERTDSLRAYAEEAVPIEAVVTKEAIFAIFNPANANPLHDGAAVITRDRISAAGCFVPLTSNPRVDKSLGTRHRAAIGLSEDTDAVVIVVSEETGGISVACDGTLNRNLDGNALRALLHTLLTSGPGRRRSAEPGPLDTSGAKNA